MTSSFYFNNSGQEGKYQVILKKVEVPIVPMDQCQQALRKTRLGPHFKLHASFVCAGGEAGRDTCSVSRFIAEVFFLGCWENFIIAKILTGQNLIINLGLHFMAV